MAGVAGLEPVTSAVTGQRSNQLSYTPAGARELRKTLPARQAEVQKIRAADAKEVGVGNPAEETYCYPNNSNIKYFRFCCQLVIPKHCSRCIPGLAVIKIFRARIAVKISYPNFDFYCHRHRIINFS